MIFEKGANLFENAYIDTEQSKASQYPGEKPPEIVGLRNLKLLQTPVQSYKRQEQERQQKGDGEENPCDDSQQLAHSYAGTAGAHGKLAAPPEEASLRKLMAAAVIA